MYPSFPFVLERVGRTSLLMRSENQWTRGVLKWECSGNISWRQYMAPDPTVPQSLIFRAQHEILDQTHFTTHRDQWFFGSHKQLLKERYPPAPILRGTGTQLFRNLHKGSHGQPKTTSRTIRRPNLLIWNLHFGFPQHYFYFATMPFWPPIGAQHVTFTEQICYVDSPVGPNS